MNTNDRVLLAHHWYMSRRGGERVFEQMAALFPGADLVFLSVNRSALSVEIARRRCHVSFLRLLTPRFCDHRWLLPLYPAAARSLPVPVQTKLILSSDASVIKGLRKPKGCVHVCYCHSPPRYLWDLSGEYLARTAGLNGMRARLFRWLLPRLRHFDLGAAQRVDHFIANSAFVAERIKRLYGRDAHVIHPGVDVSRFTPAGAPQDFYLCVGELVGYKRMDLAVKACSQSGRKLIVVGDGPEMPQLRLMAGSTVQFLGRAPDGEVAGLMSRCRALLHPQLEDFGIAAVEAQAAGRPVIAFRGGGVLETVIEGETGFFFTEQTVESLLEACDRLEKSVPPLLPEACRANAEKFSQSVFQAKLLKFLDQAVGFRSAKP